MAYVYPPITEAVFDFQFEAALSEAEIRRLGRAFAADYPKAEEMQELSINVVPGPVKVEGKFVGLKLTKTSADYIMLIRLKEFATSRLAPYEGWEKFEAESWGNYLEFKKIVGLRKLNRLALRYLNRMDIPGDKVEFSRFVSIRPSLPDILETDIHHVFGVCRYKDSKVNINCGVVPSPLIKHSSYIIDLDVFIDSAVPQQDEQVRAVFSQLRLGKNEIFEHIVTDEARRLFGGAINV